MEVDPPPALGMFVATSVYDLAYVRSWGVEMCQDNDLEAVEFDFVTTNQFTHHFRVTREGFVETDMDISLDLERTELGRKYHA